LQQLSKKSVILLGGDIFLQADLIKKCQNAYVIAADSGIRHAKPLQLKVDLWIGDFDSTSPDLAEQYKHTPRETFPKAKDTTDGALAMNAAIAQGATDLLCVGALGGARSDHVLMHFMQAVSLRQQGFTIVLTDGREVAFPIITGKTTIFLEPNSLFSIVPFTQLEGLSIRGAQWPLVNQTVPRSSTLTLSNVAHGAINISLTFGEAMFISGSLNNL
jgi:thiamine pyrophosphokinase